MRRISNESVFQKKCMSTESISNEVISEEIMSNESNLFAAAEKQ